MLLCTQGLAVCMICLSKDSWLILYFKKWNPLFSYLGGTKDTRKGLFWSYLLFHSAWDLTIIYVLTLLRSQRSGWILQRTAMCFSLGNKVLVITLLASPQRGGKWGDSFQSHFSNKMKYVIVEIRAIFNRIRVRIMPMTNGDVVCSTLCNYVQDSNQHSCSGAGNC